MIALIEAIWNWAFAHANNLHRRIVIFTAWIIAIAVIGITVNLLDAKVVNFYLSIILNLGVILIGIRPRILVGVMTAGIASDKNLPSGSINGLKAWRDVLAEFLLYASIFFLFAGTFSFKNNPGAIPAIIAALIVIFYTGLVWNMKLGFSRTLIFWFAVIMVSTGVASLVPTSVYIKYTGVNPFAILTTSVLEDKIADIEKSEKEVKEKSILVQLERIEKNIKRGKPLSQEDEKFLREQKADRDSKTIVTMAEKSLAVVKETWQTKSAQASIPPQPAPALTTKTPRVVFEKTFIGQGIGDAYVIKAVEVGKDLQMGDTVRIEGSHFWVGTNGKWSECTVWTELANVQFPNGSGFIPIGAEKGVEMKVKIIRNIQKVL